MLLNEYEEILTLLTILVTPGVKAYVKVMLTRVYISHYSHNNL